MANVAEETRPQGRKEGNSQDGNEVINMEISQQTPRMSAPAETTQAVGGQLQINGNVMNSHIQNNRSQTTSHAPLAPPMIFRTTGKEPQGTHRAAAVTTGSTQRKRSRVGDEGPQVSSPCLTKIQDHVNAMNEHIDNLQKNGHRGNTGLIRIQMTNNMREIMSEVTNVLSKMINTQDTQIGCLKAEKLMKEKIICLQEENVNLKQQIIELQAKAINKEQEVKTDCPLTYAQMANRNMAQNIMTGRQLPLPHIPQSVKHAPSECIIIYKSDVKGETKTKHEQEVFRKEVKESLTTEEQQTISAIRPTRYGGYTIIFYNEKSREQAFKKLRKKEEESGVNESDSKIVAPTKRVAKIVCKEVPSDLSIEQIKRDMYGKHNPVLQTVNNMYRMGKIYKTRLGLIFELTSYEMAAIQSQGWKIRCDLGRELKVEEYISLQQCYACAKFGHSAADCKATEEVCRLCGKSGHAGKDCDYKDDKEKWKCVNCCRMNQAKGLNLDTSHAAAQLHKCPVALQQKNIRKLQLASTGVYTTPIQKGDDALNIRPNDTSIRHTGTGPRNQKVHEKPRSAARSRSMSRRKMNPLQATHQRETGAQRLAGRGRKESEDDEKNPCVQRGAKVIQKQSENGWQYVGKKQRGNRASSMGGGESSSKTVISEEVQMEDDDEGCMQIYDETQDDEFNDV